MQRTPWPTRDSLRGQLMRSDSARFLDRMFCIDRKPSECARPWEVQAATAAFGWNVGCAQGAQEGCGKRNLLFGTLAFWNEAARAAGVDSAGIYTSTNKSVGATFGMQAESWW